MNKKQQPFFNPELSGFCSQMAMILHSGISPLEGITIMLEDSTSDREKDILQQILDTLQETADFSLSLKETSLFPSYLVHMVQIGEETGTLDEVMSALSEHYEREDSIAKSIRNAVTYPMIMIGMMLVVILVLLVKVMPIFNQVFVQLGTEMTGFSGALMHIGNAISRYSCRHRRCVILRKPHGKRKGCTCEIRETFPVLFVYGTAAGGLPVCRCDESGTSKRTDSGARPGACRHVESGS